MKTNTVIEQLMAVAHNRKDQEWLEGVEDAVELSNGLIAVLPHKGSLPEDILFFEKNGEPFPATPSLRKEAQDLLRVSPEMRSTNNMLGMDFFQTFMED